MTKEQKVGNFCTSCGKEASEKADVCLGCGCKVKGAKAYCNSCGAELKPNQVVCIKCGVSLEQKKNYVSGDKKNRIVASVIAILLGGLGIHKFYLGQGGLGVLYLLFCWTFIPAVVGLIEGVMYLTMSDEAFDEKYNKTK